MQMAVNVSTVLNSQQELLFVTQYLLVRFNTYVLSFLVLDSCFLHAPEECLVVLFFSHYSVHIQRLFSGLSAEFQMDLAKHDSITALRETQLNAECPTPARIPYTLSKHAFTWIRYTQYGRYVELHSVNIDLQGLLPVNEREDMKDSWTTGP